jgi:hypothetical protein
MFKSVAMIRTVEWGTPKYEPALCTDISLLRTAATALVNCSDSYRRYWPRFGRICLPSLPIITFVLFVFTLPVRPRDGYFNGEFRCAFECIDDELLDDDDELDDDGCT